VSSVFDNLMHDLGLLQREMMEKSVDLQRDSAQFTELQHLETGIMNTDPLNACRCFMVEFLGRDAVTLKASDADQVLTDGDVDHLHDLVNCGGGSLVAEVRKLLTEQKHIILEIGGGNVGWLLGVHCSPGEAWLLVHRGRERFTKALKSGLLDIRLNPWSVTPYYQGE
jgi:hypothetical protein